MRWRKIALLLALICAIVCVENTIKIARAENVESVLPARAFLFDENMAGKTFVFYGDSITEGYLLEVDDNDYIKHMQEEYGFYAYNGGVCGATWTAPSGSTNHIFTQINNSEILCAQADYISIFLGTNDFGNARSLGNENSRANKDTVYGAIRLALDIIIQINPDVKIMLITPAWREGGFNLKNSADYTLEEVRNAIFSVGEEYGCKVVDATEVVNAENAEKLLFADKLHLTKAGQHALAEVIKQQ